MMKISKLGQFKHISSFFQINTIKGYKYIDKAGEIINFYHKENQPIFDMSHNGLVIFNPIDKISELKISSNVFWTRFESNPTELNKNPCINITPDNLIRIYIQEAKRILQILGVVELSRVGWRNHFVFEFSNKMESDKFWDNLSLTDTLSPTKLIFNIKNGDISGALTLVRIFKEELAGEKTYGVLFDIDIFSRKKILITNTEQLLKQFRKYLVDENGFLKLASEIFF